MLFIFSQECLLISGGECVLTAVFLINRTPSPTLSWSTPYQALHGHASDYSLLRVFGALCYASTLTYGRTKFDPRASKAVFV